MENTAQKMPREPVRKNSRAGIASIAIAIFVLFILWDFLSSNFFTNTVSDDFWFNVVFFAPMLGIILALVGIFSKKREKLFAIIGLFLNLAPILFLFWVMGMAEAFR